MENERIESNGATTMVEKILLVSLLVVSLIGATRYVFPLPMASVFIITSLVLYLILCFWYIATNKFSLRTLAYFAFLIQTVGICFKLFHWPAAGGMMLIGTLNYVLIPGVLMYSAFQKPAKSSMRVLYLLISALFVFPVLSFLIDIRMSSGLSVLRFVLLLNLILAGKFMKQLGVPKEDDKMLNLTGLQVLFMLITSLGALIRAGEQEQELIQQF